MSVAGLPHTQQLRAVTATVQSLLLVHRMAQYSLFIGLSMGVVFKQNSKTFKLPSVTPQQATPDHCGVSDNMLLRHRNEVPPFHFIFLT